MFNRNLIGACVALVLALVLAACTHTPQQGDTPTRRDEAGYKLITTAPQRDCLTTGTHIALKPGECAMQPGRVYSQEDLERTGGMNPLDALRLLDPAFWH